MKLPSFEDASNTSYGWGYRGHVDYEIDFTTCEHRKFKFDEGVKVYENGLVEIAPYVWRDPRRRDNLQRKYGLQFLSLYEPSTKGYRYFTPERKPISKGWVERRYLLHDPRHKMVVATPATFYGGWARLVSEKTITVREYSAERIRAFKEKYQPLFDFAVTYRALKSDIASYWAHHTVRDMLQSGRLPTLEDIVGAPDSYRDLLVWLARWQEQKVLDSLIGKYVRIRHDLPFLYYEPA